MSNELRELTENEIDVIAGGPAFLVPLIPIAAAAFGAGYVYGSDRAKRDNARDANSGACQEASPN